MRAERQKAARKFHPESRDVSSLRRLEEWCPAVERGLAGAVHAIKVRGTACAPVWHQDFGRQLAVPAGDETHGSSFPVDVHGQGKSKTLCPQSRPRAWAVSYAAASADGFREVSLIPSVHVLLSPHPSTPHPSPFCFPPRKTPHRDLPKLLGKAERDRAKDMGRRGRSLLPSLLL